MSGLRGEKHHTPAIRRPARAAGHGRVHEGQLLRVGAVGIANPDFVRAGAVRSESDPAAIRRIVRAVIAPRGENVPVGTPGPPVPAGEAPDVVIIICQGNNQAPLPRESRSDGSFSQRNTDGTAGGICAYAPGCARPERASPSQLCNNRFGRNGKTVNPLPSTCIQPKERSLAKRTPSILSASAFCSRNLRCAAAVPKKRRPF